VTTIQTMQTLPLADVKARFSALASAIEAEQDQITVTRNGVPAVVVVSVSEWESLQETIAVLSDPATMSDLREAAETRAAGEVHSTEEVLAEFEARRARSQ
jgi:antitoxin YefM